MTLPDILVPTFVQMPGALPAWLEKAEAQKPDGGAEMLLGCRPLVHAPARSSGERGLGLEQTLRDRRSRREIDSFRGLALPCPNVLAEGVYVALT
jgi:hypothetical protein